MSPNGPSDDDINLFRETMKSVRPLKKTNTPPLLRPPTASIPPLRPRTLEKPRPVPLYLSNHYTDEVHSECQLAFSVEGVPHKRRLELRKGEIRLEGRLDLHGLTLPEAQDRLVQFITEQSRMGHRCVLVIHGKGSPTGRAPVLKNNVNHWLKQFPQLLAFHSALPRDGGAGAIYVLLKRILR